jgi:uncharacterized protein
MAIQVLDDPGRRRFEIVVNGQTAGFTTYRNEEGSVALDHTQIDPRWQGRGLASQLIGESLDKLRARGATVVPYCPFVRDFIVHHPGYADLVPVAHRSLIGG